MKIGYPNNNRIEGGSYLLPEIRERNKPSFQKKLAKFVFSAMIATAAVKGIDHRLDEAYYSAVPVSQEGLADDDNYRAVAAKAGDTIAALNKKYNPNYETENPQSVAYNISDQLDKPASELKPGDVIYFPVEKADNVDNNE